MSDHASTHGNSLAGSGNEVSSVRRSVMFSALDKYFVQILQIGTTAVMARLLTPAETGLYLVAQAVIMLADNFRDFGVGNYLVQERDLHRGMVRASFTVTLLLSLPMGFLIYLGAGQIAALYQTPELALLLMVSALNFVYVPFATPPMALLRRDLAFNALAFISIVAAVANSATTIVLGLAGFGAVSYAWGFVASGLVVAVLAIALRPDVWVFRPSLRDARALVSFGSVSTLVTIVNMAYDMFPRLVLGKILGFDAVGLYGRALTVCQIPERAVISALQPVVLPAMARRVRQGGELRSAYLRGHTLVSAVQWPMLIMLALLADPVVRILLGEQWDHVPALVRVMAPAMMALAPAFMTFPLLVAVGRLGDTLWASLISLPPSILILIAAAKVSLETVALSLFLTAPLQMFVALWFIRRAIGLTWSDVWRASWRSTFLAVSTAVLPFLIVAMSPTGFDLDWAQAGLAVLGGMAGWLVGVRALEHPIGAELAHVLQSLRARLKHTTNAWRVNGYSLK